MLVSLSVSNPLIHSKLSTEQLLDGNTPL